LRFWRRSWRPRPRRLSLADRWEKSVAAYDEADRTATPPKGEIVFVGSSTIRRWDVASVDFERFVRAVHTRLPQTRILYLGIKPSPLAAS
jgi:hypothetical protein